MQETKNIYRNTFRSEAIAESSSFCAPIIVRSTARVAVLNYYYSDTDSIMNRNYHCLIRVSKG